LKKFKKIYLEPEEATTVRFTLSFEDWSVFDPQIGNGFHRTAEDGDFVVGIKPDTDCDVYNNMTSPLCAKFELKTGFLPY
jgi:beta-glucosidase